MSVISDVVRLRRSEHAATNLDTVAEVIEPGGSSGKTGRGLSGVRRWRAAASEKTIRFTEAFPFIPDGRRWGVLTHRFGDVVGKGEAAAFVLWITSRIRA